MVIDQLELNLSITKFLGAVEVVEHDQENKDQ